MPPPLGLWWAVSIASPVALFAVTTSLHAAEAVPGSPAPPPPTTPTSPTSPPPTTPATPATPTTPTPPAPPATPPTPAAPATSTTPTPATPPTPAPPTSSESSLEATDELGAETVIIEDKAPTPPGTTSLDAQTARSSAGALGEPLRALALLPGVTTSVAAIGYPIIRGSLPGESRYTFDGIELPLLYHLGFGNQVVHPSFLADLELRAGGHGPEQGQLIGGHVSMTPAQVTKERFEVRANTVEVGTFYARPLDSRTEAAAALRAGTLSLVAKVVDSDASLYYVDQQTRLTHQLASGDRVSLTSLGALDVVGFKDKFGSTDFKLGFHRFDARWKRRRPAGSLTAGVQTAADLMRVREETFPQPGEDLRPEDRVRKDGGWSWGGRAYADGELALGRALTVRGGVEARYRSLNVKSTLIDTNGEQDPFFAKARAVNSQGAWTAATLNVAKVTASLGVRGERYATRMAQVSPVHYSVDPRLSLAVTVTPQVSAELAAGLYTAPPQLTIVEGPIAVGPVPLSEGFAANAGLSRAKAAQVAIKAKVEGFDTSLAVYGRDTDAAMDFGLINVDFASGACGEGVAAPVSFERQSSTRAAGVEVMARRALGSSADGWVSYSLAKIDRRVPIGTFAHDFDQRHTLNAAAQWRLGKWTVGAAGHLHTGRPAKFPRVQRCELGPGQIQSIVVESPATMKRLPSTWRVDLRGERQLGTKRWDVRLYFELQNAFLRPEYLGYETRFDFSPQDPTGNTYSSTVETLKLTLPVPMIGVEAHL